jgi:hypothetical protein
MEDFPLAVEGNSIYVEDDFTYGSPGLPAFGYGIGLMNSTDNKSIISNTISGISSIPISAISAVFCKLNLGNNSPNVHCNFTSNSYYGFQFDDWNGDAIWEANHMCNEWAGLALTNNGIIGPQGNSAFGCDNGWEEAPLYPLCQPWGVFAPSGSGYQTYVDQTSDATNSPLYCVNLGWNLPTSNGLALGGVDYGQPGALFSPAGLTANPVNVDCAQDNTSTVPSWRSQPSGNNANLKFGEYFSEEAIRVFPNPTNGQLNIIYEDPSSSCSLRILDLRGQIVYSDVIKGGTDYHCNIFTLPASIYIIELKKENKIIHKKLIKVN